MKEILERCEHRNDCLVWTGALNDSGYGVKKIGNKFWYVHRFVWQYTNGIIPDGMQVDHTCFNRQCVDINHLRLLPSSENARTHQYIQRKSKCKYGHALDRSSGRARCKRCAVAAVLRFRKK